MHVKALLRGMTAKQLLGWERFYEIEPLGEDREDVRSASLRQLIYNTNVSQKDRKSDVRDFLIAFTEEDWEAIEKRREENNWSTAQWMVAEQRAYAELNAEREAAGLDKLPTLEV